jgi:hypothetical protein
LKYVEAAFDYVGRRDILLVERGRVKQRFVIVGLTLEREELIMRSMMSTMPSNTANI